MTEAWRWGQQRPPLQSSSLKQRNRVGTGCSHGDGTSQPCYQAGQGCDGVRHTYPSPELQPAGSAAPGCAEPSRGAGKTPTPGPIHTPATRRVLLLSLHCCRGVQPATAAGSLGTVRQSCSNQQHRSFTAAFACRSAAGDRSPERTIQGKPLMPCGHDPRGPRGDGSLSTNQGPNTDWGQVSKVGRGRGSRPHDWTNKERENKAASCLKRDT